MVKKEHIFVCSCWMNLSLCKHQSKSKASQFLQKLGDSKRNKSEIWYVPDVLDELIFLLCLRPGFHERYIKRQSPTYVPTTQLYTEIKLNSIAATLPLPFSCPRQEIWQHSLEGQHRPMPLRSGTWVCEPGETERWKYTGTPSALFSRFDGNTYYYKSQWRLGRSKLQWR